MKKLYIICLLLLAGIGVSAQNFAVTFQVDMSNETAADTVSVAGSFQAADGGTDWTPGATVLTDGNSDGIYTYTAMIPAGSYEYKFLNGKAWGTDESVPGGCATNNNRGITVSGDTTIGVVCFGMCGPCPSAVDTAYVTFAVDMSNETVSANGVHVAGAFGGAGYPNWDPAGITLTNTSGNIYSTTLKLPQGDYQFKFVNGNDWSSPESVPTACEVSSNREYSVMGDNDNESEVLTDTSTYLVAFGACLPVDSVDVTIKLDMKGQILCGGGVHVPGAFDAGGYPAWDPAGIALTDDNSDMVYEVTLRLPEGTYAHKFVNGSDWGGVEAIPGACLVDGNRSLEVMGNGDAFSDVLSQTYEICFASCAMSCPAVNDPIDVTFRVDMNNEIVDAGGVYVAGTLPCAGWVKDSFEMKDDDGDGVYEYTWTDLPTGLYQFKFYNGTCGDDGCSETHDFKTDGCGDDNGVGGWNRTIDLSSATANTILPAYFWNSCDESSASVKDLNLDVFNVFPNPAKNQVTIKFNNDLNANFTASLVDLTGRELVSNQGNANEITLNWNSITSGLYIVKLTNASGAIATKKLFVD